jgi:hypothetical protein
VPLKLRPPKTPATVGAAVKLGGTTVKLPSGSDLRYSPDKRLLIAVTPSARGRRMLRIYHVETGQELVGLPARVALRLERELFPSG